MRPNALVITAPGINCDLELVHALEQAGAAAGPVHLNRLIAEPALLEKARIIGLPGGFSYGDSIAAGRIFAQLVRRHLYRPLVEALQRKGVRVSVVSTIRSQPPMIADDLRRQADNFIELDELKEHIGRPPRPEQRPEESVA